ncbi:hypothetical protein [Acaryochloris sp. CCMEE 5410]|uniref:hypothetical protein n=1 Tax=Acaryochloris sp. CCMEE 5410 TaxID=310037 RepID=UPI0002483B51|nr:hypothetical protein [Acaryochloris sp. CCMEE 5410]KAI9133036.1 hypothetical protein ON05_006640 [Acaryochloris sp. CCMEE 5410]
MPGNEINISKILESVFLNNPEGQSQDSKVLTEKLESAILDKLSEWRIGAQIVEAAKNSINQEKIEYVNLIDKYLSEEIISDVDFANRISKIIRGACHLCRLF